MRKLLALMVAGTCALCLFGCGNGSNPASSDQPAKQDAPASANQVVVYDSAWSADGGYIEYDLVLENKGDDLAESTTVQIVGKSADGKVISSDDEVFFDIQPGEIVAFSGQVGNGTAPDAVEFTVLS